MPTIIPSLLTKYYRGISPDELVAGFDYSSGRGNPAIFHQDPLETITGLSGQAVKALITDPFGQFSSVAGGFATPSTAAATTRSELTYAGRDLDFDAHLYYMRARYYDPLIGRFLSEDPLGFVAGANFYTYANNNPVNHSDPTGQYDQITQSGNNVTITFPALFIGAKATPAAVDAYSQQIAGAWSGYFGGINYKTVVTTPPPGTPRNQINVIEVGDLNPKEANGKPFTSALGGDYMKLGPLDDPKTHDYNLWTAGHEAGHAMGLADMYNNNGALPGYQQNIMGIVQGVPELQDFKNIQLLNSIGYDGGHPGYTAPDSAAAGGFLIYQNMPNTNSLQVVYHK